MSSVNLYWRQGKSIVKYPWEVVSHVVHVWTDAEKGLRVCLYTEEKRFFIFIADRSVLGKAYFELSKCAYLMGNPIALVPAGIVERDAEAVNNYVNDACKGVTLDGKLDGYLFGGDERPPSKRGSKIPESELIQSVQHKLSQPFVDWKQVDDAIAELVVGWEASHHGLQAAHSCALLLINRSDGPIRMQSPAILRGDGFVVIGVTEFLEQARILKSGGIALVFAWGHTPTAFENGMVKLTVTLDNVLIHLSSSLSKTRVEVSGGRQANFLEKNSRKMYGKYTLLLS